MSILNKRAFMHVSSLALVCSLLLLPVNASADLQHDIAKMVKNQVERGNERGKWLSEFNKTYLNPFGVYEAINSLPSKFSNLFLGNAFIKEAATIAVKTPLKFYLTKHVCSQNFLYILETFLSQKVLEGMPKDISGPVSQTPGFIADIASDYSMGELSSVAGLVYDHVIKTLVKTYIKSMLGEAYADLGSAYVKAIIRSLVDPYQDDLQNQAMDKINELAAEENVSEINSAFTRPV